MTELLANALRSEDISSLLALKQFFDLPAENVNVPRTKLDLGLVECARLFIDGPNASDVERWIQAYEMSEPESKRRLLYQNILCNFISSESQVRSLKYQLGLAKSLSAEILTKCDELKRIVTSLNIWAR